MWSCCASTRKRGPGATQRSRWELAALGGRIAQEQHHAFEFLQPSSPSLIRVAADDVTGARLQPLRRFEADWDALWHPQRRRTTSYDNSQSRLKFSNLNLRFNPLPCLGAAELDPRYMRRP